MRLRRIALVLAAVGALQAQAANKPTAEKQATNKASNGEPALKVLRNEAWSCTPVATPQGMVWRQGQWWPGGFQAQEPFTLYVRLAQESPEETFLTMITKTGDDQDNCDARWDHDPRGNDTCVESGRVVEFSRTTRQGAIAYLFGASMSGDNRDSLPVMPFACHPV